MPFSGLYGACVDEFGNRVYDYTSQADCESVGLTWVPYF